jgi:multiple sugar transport system permease protein
MTARHPIASGALRTSVLHLTLAAAAALTVTPLLWMVAASFMPAGEATALPPRLLPSTATLDHYRTLMGTLDLGRAFANSVLVATIVTAVSLLLNSLAGYGFARFRFAGRDRLFALLMAALVVPGQIAMLPLFLLLRELGLVDTYLGVVIPGLASIFGIFLIRQHALAIPQSLLDAARIDGAGELRIYWSIALPAIRPALVTLGVFTFLGTWNDFLWPLIVLADGRRYTLPVALASLLGEHAQDTELMMAGAVLTVVPVIVLFLALQRFYVAGIVSGAVKE